VEGEPFRRQIALAIGVTVPEARDLGLLPYQIIPMRRETDGVSLEQYRGAMIQEGASVLENPDQPLLRFASLEEAAACKRRLEEKLPNSHWTIIHEVGT